MNLFHAMRFSVEQYFGLHVLDSVYCSIPSKYHNTVISTTSLLKNKKKGARKQICTFKVSFLNYQSGVELKASVLIQLQKYFVLGSAFFVPVGVCGSRTTPACWVVGLMCTRGRELLSTM